MEGVWQEGGNRRRPKSGTKIDRWRLNTSVAKCNEMLTVVEFEWRKSVYFCTILTNI